uniref:TSA: Wollemia nobilis Ref_Wollemi_Transcript_14198_1611 transcribed RNA sequence n=1 Tax=Wollemia nobilis TaxID=56998 RepID=A0A0C9S6X4_9CONI
MEWLFLVVTVVAVGLATILLEIAKVIWWKPLQLKKYFESQGLEGPPYKLFYGNAPDIVRMASQESSKPLTLSDHNIFARVNRAFDQWRKAYGQEFVFWFGTKPRLFVPHPELAKEILSSKFGHYKKIQSRPEKRQGLTQLQGEKWAQHRRILNPAFRMELLKGMTPLFVESTVNMLQEWSKLVSLGSKEIDVHKEFGILTSDVISRTAFGSSYTEGKRIFDLQAQHLVLMFERFRSVQIPGSRFLPTRKNRQQWWYSKEIRRCIRQVIEGRESAVSNKKAEDYGTDLLGLMMTSNKRQGGGKLQNMSMTVDEIITECQTFYLAGQETTATLLTWTIILLGMHQDWQERARREVLEVCGKNDFPNADAVNGLKIVGMVLNECLRLYPPVLGLTRQTYKAMQLGRFSIPEGTGLLISILAIHHDPALWGNDVLEFNPERFSQGFSKAAKHPMAFMPFGLGPKSCIGQNLSLLEAKVVLAMILQRFSFVISSHYIHAPVQRIMLKPQHGAQVIFHTN